MTNNITPIRPVRMDVEPESSLVAEPAAMSLDHVNQKTGLISGARANMATRAEAGRAKAKIEKRQIQAVVRIAETQIAVAEQKASIATVLSALPIITEMTEQLTTATNQADARVSLIEAASIQSIMVTRQHTRGEVTRISNEHGLPDGETEALISFVDGNAAADIQAAIGRSAQTKESNQILHDRALAGIKAAKLPTEKF